MLRFLNYRLMYLNPRLCNCIISLILIPFIISCELIKARLVTLNLGYVLFDSFSPSIIEPVSCTESEERYEEHELL